MEPLTILFDADDVVEDLCGRWVSFVNQCYGTHVSPEDITDWNIGSFFPTLTRDQVYGVLTSPEMWRGIEPIPGAAETLGRFRDEGHQLYMVTATDYRTPPDKFERIFEFIPWLDWKHVIVTSNKQLVKGDVLIDDGPHNLVGGDYMKLLFDRPHNRNFDAKASGVIRMKTWEEIDYAVHLHAKMKAGMKKQQQATQQIFGGGFLW